METKSRYEVIAELETKKRELIKERDGLNDTLLDKEKKLKVGERQKADTIVNMDRQLEDIKEDITNFKNSLVEKKETISELIKSVNDSLDRFKKLQE